MLRAMIDLLRIPLHIGACVTVGVGLVWASPSLGLLAGTLAFLTGTFIAGVVSVLRPLD